MTKKQQEKLDYIYNILTECKLTLSTSHEESKYKTAKKQLYIPLKEHLLALLLQDQ